MVDLIKNFATIELFSDARLRKTPFRSGYRPLFNLPGATTKISGSIKIIGADYFYPGSKGNVEITFIKEMIDDGYCKTGVKFTFDEGRDILGEGEIR
ncbi:hypothetical protein [Chitinophaga sp.]|uniref:hypothetical protein n=1 Tax=Chitinophaga sp. TaxID=1869181 RepID=UPI0031D721C2